MPARLEPAVRRRGMLREADAVESGVLGDAAKPRERVLRQELRVVRMRDQRVHHRELHAVKLTHLAGERSQRKSWSTLCGAWLACSSSESASCSVWSSVAHSSSVSRPAGSSCAAVDALAGGQALLGQRIGLFFHVASGRFGGVRALRGNVGVAQKGEHLLLFVRVLEQIGRALRRGRLQPVV